MRKPWENSNTPWPWRQWVSQIKQIQWALIIHCQVMVWYIHGLKMRLFGFIYVYQPSLLFFLAFFLPLCLIWAWILWFWWHKYYWFTTKLGKICYQLDSIVAFKMLICILLQILFLRYFWLQAKFLYGLI